MLYVTHAECIECAERTEYSNIIQLIFVYKSRAIAEAVNRRHLTAEAWVRPPTSPCAIYGGKSGSGTSTSPSTSVVSCRCHSFSAPYTSSSTR